MVLDVLSYDDNDDDNDIGVCDYQFVFASFLFAHLFPCLWSSRMLLLLLCLDSLGQMALEHGHGISPSFDILSLVPVTLQVTRIIHEISIECNDFGYTLNDLKKWLA